MELFEKSEGFESESESDSEEYESEEKDKSTNEISKRKTIRKKTNYKKISPDDGNQSSYISNRNYSGYEDEKEKNEKIVC